MTSELEDNLSRGGNGVGEMVITNQLEDNLSMGGKGVGKWKTPSIRSTTWSQCDGLKT